MNARIVVVGICMGRDSLEPMMAINKELNVQFVIFYSPEEYAASLQGLAEGRIPVNSLISDRVPLGQVSQAFQWLSSPESHTKIVVRFGA
jgi:threonine dehydrogenase-like Zn-dependent dehydrogenase